MKPSTPGAWRRVAPSMDPARLQIEQVVREMPSMMPGVPGQGNPHLFGHLLAMHQPIGLRLYSDSAALIWPHNIPPERDETERVRRLLADARRRDEIWIEEGKGQEW